LQNQLDKTVLQLDFAKGNR